MALGSLLTVAMGMACEARNLGEQPPEARFFFPSGLLLEPVEYDPQSPDPDRIALPSRYPELSGPRFLYVANGNNDRSYNAGTLAAVDLRAFWRAWYEPGPVDPEIQASCEAAIAAAETAVAAERAAKAAAIQSGLPYEMDAANQAVIDEAFAVCESRGLRDGGLDPYCHTLEGPEGSFKRCVLAPGSPIDESAAIIERPCRRLPLLPRVVECDEQAFVRSTVRIGDFATTLTASREGDALRLWLPVRGDPSVTYVDAIADPDDADGNGFTELRLDCDQSPRDQTIDPNLCGDSHRLDRLRNDISLDPLDREPFNIAIWESERSSTDAGARGQRLGFVAHAAGSQLSMIDLDGIRGDDEPALVDLTDLYVSLSGAVGGFGLAIRPCFDAGLGPLGELDPLPNMPALTQECRRPLVYTSFRFAGQLASFTASGLELGEGFSTAFPPEDRESCQVRVPAGCTVEVDDTGTSVGVDCGGGAASVCADDDSSCTTVYAGPYCGTPTQLGLTDEEDAEGNPLPSLPCAVACEPQVRGSRRILPSLLIDSSLSGSAVLGDMAFADPRGDQLLILQTNPGALLSLDTSLGDDGEPLDIPSAPPVEICAEPSRMKIYTERAPDGTPIQRYALITCFRAALVYIVDLEALRVVDAVVVGTGPHDIAIDDAREVAYIINNLESSVSVVDLSRRRATRFQEMARLGLQDPFSQ